MTFHNVPPNGFPDLPDVEELEAVQKDVKTLKTTTAEQGAAITNLNSTKANQITIAPFFSAETAYDPGDLVYYNGLSYRCVNAHEGEWDADDFAATTIAGELASVKSGLTNVGNATDLGNVQGSNTITLSDAVTNYRFVHILVGYYTSGYPCFGHALLPVSALLISADDIPINVAYSDINETNQGYVDISFLSETSVKVVNTVATTYTRFVGIA